MSAHCVHLERLVGKKVYDPAGRCAGRIEEVLARWQADGSCAVEEFHLGTPMSFEDPSFSDLLMTLLRPLGTYNHNPTHRVRWDQMDLSDPGRPRLRIPADQVEELKQQGGFSRGRGGSRRARG